MTVSRFGVVGAGWRAEYFVKIAKALPGRFEVAGVVVRNPEKAREVSARWGVPAVSSVPELLAAGPLDFVISAVTWDANPGVVTELAGHGIRVLSETPPAPDEESLRQLWDDTGSSGLVQVAEQYVLMPGHAARLAAVERAAIGAPSSVQVSSTHGYHAVSLIRGLLGLLGSGSSGSSGSSGMRPVTASAQSFSAPLVDPITRAGWTGDDQPKPAASILATLDFGGGQHGVYDFTDNQWHNPLRGRRIVVRGTCGELAGDDLVRLTGPGTIVHSSFVRRQLGYDLNLEGYDSEHISLDGEVLWRNNFLGARFSDEDLAIAELLARTAAWARDDGPPPYPLAEGCQDQLISLAIDASLAIGAPVTTARHAWAS